MLGICLITLINPMSGFAQNFGDDQVQAGSQQVESLRLWHSPNKTRIVFDVSENVTHSMFTLDQPLRLVVDIKNANLSGKLPPLDISNEHIAAVRSGQPAKDTLRVVFDLKKALNATDFILSPNELYGHRLVVDLEDVSASSLTASQANQSPTALLPTPGRAPTSTAGVSSIENGKQVSNNKPDVVTTTRAEANEPQTPQFRPLIIAIDAGHGGEDPGALGHRGSKEKEITMAIANRLAKIVDQDPGMKSFLVRQGDYYIELHKRREMAHAQQADMFISIHADAFRKKSARGFSVFALSQSGATSAMARALAAKENASDLIGGVSLADKDEVLAKVLVDLSMSNTISESVNFGGRVLKEFKKLGKLHSSRVEQAGFAVLKSADIPSVLVETGFITNPEEERNLRSSSYQRKVAQSLYTAIKDYFAQTPYRSNATYASYSVPGSSPITQIPETEYQSLVRPGDKKRSGSAKRKASTRPASHKVVRGDSLSKIALRYGTSVTQIKRLNNLRSDTVVLGQRLKVPGSVAQSNASTNRSSSVKPAFHTVVRGDSLSKISQRYNVTIRSLKAVNGFTRNTVFVGQKLKIPGGRATVQQSEPRTHRVKRGDTLSEIAQLYGSSMSKIMRANSLKSRTVLLGQVLKIPN